MILSTGEVPGYQLFVPLPEEILWSAIFIAIFAIVFIRFVLPRMNAVLDERSEKIEGGIRHAEEVQSQVDQIKADQEQELASARQEAASIRERARQDGERILEEAKARAEAENERILGAGRQQLQAERIAASAELRGEVGTLASSLASKIIGESLDDDARSQRVIDRFLDDLESSEASTR